MQIGPIGAIMRRAVATLVVLLGLISMPECAISATPTLSANGSTQCLLRANGAVTCWGFDYGGKVAPPAGPFEQISVGTWSACALQANGSVVCWGQDAASVSLPAGTYTQIDAGRGMTCGVREDQKIVCAASYFGGSYTPFPNEDDLFTHVASGWGAVCGVRTSGELACTGFQSIEVPPGTFTKVFGDKTANFLWCAIRTNGEVVCWGNENYRRTETPTGTFTEVGIGLYHACGLRTDQTIACWGYFGNQDYRQYFPPSGQFLSLGVDDVSNCALSATGKVQCWGIDQAGEAPRLDIRPHSITAAEAGVPYSLKLDVFDKGTIWTYAPYQPVEPLMMVSAGQLPSGITLGSTGLLEGTASAPGSWPLTVFAQDANGLEVERSMVFTVVEPGEDVTPPIIVPQVNGLNEQGDWYKTDVLLHWDISDPESQAISTADCEDVSILVDTPITGLSYTCVARSAGGTISETFELRRDATPPVVTIRSVEPVAPGYYRAHFIATDALSDLNFTECQIDGYGFSFCDSRTSDIVGPLDDGPHTFEVRAADNAGNYSAPVARVIQQQPADTTPPAIVPIVVGTSGTHGWYLSDVYVSWTVSDPESEIASTNACDPVSVTADTTGDQFTCSATSEGGASQRSIIVRRDVSAPETSLTSAPESPTLSTSATFVFGGADTTSGIQGFECSLDGESFGACASPRTFTGLSVGSHSLSVRAVDMAGNTDATPAVHGWTILPPPDTTPPLITPQVTGLTGQNGWYVGPVQVSWTVADPEGPILGATGCGVSQLSSDTTGTELTCTASSAGGTTSRSVTIRLDATAPDLQVSLPASNLIIRSTQAALPTAYDAISGVVTATCPALQTATIGAKTMTCTTRDVAGNSRALSVSYLVIYQLSYTNVAIGPAVINQAPPKQNVTIAWRLVDFFGQPITNLANAFIRDESAGCGPITNPVINPLTPSTGPTGFRNLGNGNYSYSFKPPKGWRPSCRYQYIEVGDGAWWRSFTITYPTAR